MKAVILAGGVGSRSERGDAGETEAAGRNRRQSRFSGTS